MAAFVSACPLPTVFLQSMLRVVVNRQKGDRIALIVGHLVQTTVAHVASRRRTYSRIQECPGLGSPPLFPVADNRVVRAGANGFLAHDLVLAGGAEPVSCLPCQRVGSPARWGFSPRPIFPASCSQYLKAHSDWELSSSSSRSSRVTEPQLKRELRVAWLYARAGPAPTVQSLVEWLHRLGKLPMQPPFGRTGKRGSYC